MQRIRAGGFEIISRSRNASGPANPFLQTTRSGEPQPVFKLNWIADLNCQIALAKDKQHVIVTDGKTIYHVGENGKAQKLRALEALQLDGVEEKIRDSICWYFATSKSRDVLFFVLASGTQQSVCKLELETRKLQSVSFPFAAGIDVDVDAGIVYGPVGPTFKRVLLKDFGRTPDRSLPTSTDYYLCRLSPDAKQLLLSCHDLQPGRPIALMDAATGAENVLPITGSQATWGADNTVFFLHGSNSLWRYPLSYSTVSRRYQFVEG